MKEFKKIAEKSGIQVTFIERTGFSLQNQLEQADPYKRPDCEREDCFQCEEEGGGDCEKRGPGYVLKCKEEGCTGHYDGQSGRNGYTRGIEHKKGYMKKKEGNVLVDHDKEYHGGRGEAKYKMEARRTFGRDNRRRMMDEAVRIQMNLGIMMNRKGEFRNSVLPRLQVHRGAER